jgi:hypothetical protein
MGTITRYRFRGYTVRPKADPLTPPTLTAVCVTRDDQDRGATSGEMRSADEHVRRIATHCARINHQLYERSVRETVRTEPGAWQ